MRIGRLVVTWLRAITAISLLSIAIILQIGRFSAIADFVNNFAPLIGATSALIALIALLTRPRFGWLFGASTLALASAGSRVLPEYLTGSPSSPSRNGEILRLVAFNMYKDNPSLDRTADWIIRQGADIVVLEEVPNISSETREVLSKAYPYSVDCSSNGRCSTILLAKRRPLASGGLARDDPENRKGVSAVWARFGDAHGDYVVIGVHLQRPPPMGRQADARIAVARLIHKINGSRTIVMGDFNTTPWTFAMRGQDRLFGLPRLSRGLPTWPAPWPIFPIDHVYAGKGWTLARIERGPFVGSDHLALSIDLAVAR